MKLPAFALLTTLFLPPQAMAAEGEYRYERKYQAGQKFSYTYERRESMDGRLFRAIRGTSVHEIKAAPTPPAPVPPSPGKPKAPPPPPTPPTPPAPRESITWSSMKQAFEPGRVEDNTDVAKQAPAMGLNLPMNTAVIMPQLPPSLMQATEDLRGAYQTFNPTHLEKLKKVGDKVVTPAHYANWGNVRVGQSGAQCTTEVMELLKLDNEKATFRRQTRPSKDCKELKFPLPEMSSPLIPGSVVGMYFVERKGAKLTTGWGSYENTYEVEVSRADGRPLRMQAKNVFYSTRRADCDSNFRNCQVPEDGYLERMNVGEQSATFVLN